MERNDAKHRGMCMYSNRVVWCVRKLLWQLFQGQLMVKWQWKRDVQIAHIWGINFANEQPLPLRIIVWHKPLLGEFNLNVDGSSKDNF